METTIFVIVFLGMLSLFFLTTELKDAFIRIKKQKRLKKTFGIKDQDKFSKLNPRLNYGLNNGQKPSREKIGRFSIKALSYLLITANIPLSPLKFIFITLAAALSVFFSVWMLSQSFPAGIALFIICLVIPFIFLFLKKQSIQKELIEQMPDALGMIVRAIKVGQSVDAALKDAADSMPVPFSTEIRIIYEEIRMGLPFDQALGNFENRYPGLADVKIFCTSFIIQRETGGSLTQILEGLANTIKKRFHFQRQIRTFSSEARISALVIGLLPLLFVLVTYIFNPGYITRLTDNFIGRIIISGAFALELIGFIIMRNMAKIKI